MNDMRVAILVSKLKGGYGYRPTYYGHGFAYQPAYSLGYGYYARPPFYRGCCRW